MAVITSWLVKRTIYAKTSADRALVFYLLVTMASMFGGAIIYLLSPSITSIVEAVALNAVLMTGGIIVVLRFWAERFVDEKIATSTALSNSQNTVGTAVAAPTESLATTSFGTRVGAVFLILLNEFLMGWTFVLASGSPSTNTVLSTFDSVIGSDWFIFTMALEMILSIYMLRSSLPKNFFIIILFQSVIMFFAPTALNNVTWVTASIYLGSVAMIGLLIFFYEYLFNHRTISVGIRQYLVALMSIYALMMGGLYVWLVQGSSLLFVISIIAEMTLYFDAILRGDNIEASPTRSWILDPWWVFAFLGMTFMSMTGVVSGSATVLPVDFRLAVTSTSI